MKLKLSSLDQAYLRWRGKFASFEATCFGALCEFVRVHFDDLLDHFYLEGHESLKDFPAWAFERYMQEVDRKKGQGESAVTVASAHVFFEPMGGSSVCRQFSRRQLPRKHEEWRAPE